ncbi:MAG: hypothetical protein U0457_02495 [Candidatus Sericytochromatia bacterium]
MKNKTDLEIKANKKDSVGLFTGKFKTQVFKSKKELLEQEQKKHKNKNYNDEVER